MAGELHHTEMLEKPFFFVTIGTCQSVLFCTYGVMIIVNFIKISYFPRTFSVLLVIPTVGLSFSIIKITVLSHIFHLCHELAKKLNYSG